MNLKGSILLYHLYMLQLKWLLLFNMLRSLLAVLFVVVL